MRESMANPQLRHRRMFVETEHPVDGPVTQLAFPIKFSEFDFEVERPAPGHGEHTSDILADLGYTVEAITGFRRNGVV
jgi:crotonobetainyl-CoA:carnitine CoA-transferase CaiB-like acyl-CoA transferase